MGFVHHQKSVIFVQHIEVNGWSCSWRRCSFFSPLTLQHFHRITRKHRGFCSVNDFIVDDNPSLSEHFSEGGGAGLRKHGPKHRQKIAVRRCSLLHLASPTGPTRRSIHQPHPIGRAEVALSHSHWQDSPDSPNLDVEVGEPSFPLPSMLTSRGGG